MISHIGKKFLKKLNEKEGTNYTPWEFFEKVMHPMFFDCNHAKYLMYIQNTPFTSGVDINKGKYNDPEFRKAQLLVLKEKFSSKSFDMSCVIGGGTADVTQSTSGQYDPMYYQKTADEKIYSWIGQALAIGISGGYTVLFENFDILYITYKGWFKYREFLSSEMYKDMEGKQLSAWSGINLNIELDLRGNERDIAQYIEKGRFKTIQWSLIFSNLYNICKTNMYAYIYKLGKLNSTVGLIVLNMEGINRPVKWYKKLFGENVYLEDMDKMLPLLGSSFTNIPSVCQYGHIGVYSMRPEKPEKFDKAKIEFKIYKSWVMATINNEQMYTMSEEFAKALLKFNKESRKGETAYSHMVDSVLGSYNKKTFRKELIKILETKDLDYPETKELSKLLDSAEQSVFERFIDLTKINYLLK